MYIIEYMSFWTNVSYELESQGISRKELAYKIDVKEMTIHKAIERDSVPSADTAIRISKALHVSLEYLLDISQDKESVNPREKEEIKKAIRLYRKYNSIISNLEKLSSKEIDAVTSLINCLSK